LRKLEKDQDAIKKGRLDALENAKKDQIETKKRDIAKGYLAGAKDDAEIRE